MNAKKIAFVGAGTIAKAHYHAFSSISGCSIVGVCDPSTASYQAFTEFAKVSLPHFVEASEMIAQTRPDAIVIMTPPSQREELLKIALDNQCSVLMEKPLARDLEAAKRLVLLTESHGGVYAVGFCHRFVPAVQYFRDLIQSKCFGELVLIENTFGGPSVGMAEHWMSDPKVSGGGIMLDACCHSLDMMHFLTGEITDLKSVLRHSWPGRGEDTCCIIGRTESEALLRLTGSWLFPNGDFSLRLRFEKAEVVYDYAATYQLKEQGKDWVEMELPAPANVRFIKQAEAFIAAMNGVDTVNATFKDALKVNEEIERLYSESSS